MVQSIERGIEILKLLEAGPLGVTELANATALPKTTVHRLLKTFEAHHWVEFNGAKRYQLSWGVLPMAKSFLTSLDVRAITSLPLAVSSAGVPYTTNVQGACNVRFKAIAAVQIDGPCKL